MKKVMFGLAAAAAIAAFGTGIESANTVGYQTTTVKAKKGKTTKSYKIKEVLKIMQIT